MIDFLDVTKSYSGKDLLSHVSFRINRGDRVGVVGPNGAGKSTVFRLLTDLESFDSGKIQRPKDLRIGYLHQELKLDDAGRELLEFAADAKAELNTISRELRELEHRLHANEIADDGREAALRRHGELQTAFEHAGGYELRTRAAIALAGLGFREEDISKPLQAFSGGWQMRAALARVLIADPELLMLDEPSNYLDIPAVEWLCKFLKAYGGTLLLVSHDRFLLNKLTNVTLEVNAGMITRYPGNYDYYRREREARFASLSAAKRNQDRRARELERNIERFRAKSSKAAQARSWQKTLDKMEEIALPDELAFSGTIRLPAPPPAGTEAARFEDVSFSYTTERTILANLDFAIDTGEKIAFIGYNGTGKTTLLRLLTGRLTPQEGRIVPGHNIVIGYQAQEFAEVLEPELSVYDVVKQACGRNFPAATIPNVLGSFGFSGDDMNKPCQVLSGGEKIRLCFARLFVNPPNLLLLDEPTTHLDVAAREALQAVLKSFKGTVCIVSHDVEFVRAVADHIVAMRPPGIRKYFGNYDYYLEKCAEEQQTTAAPAASAGKDPDDGQESSKDRRRERARLRNALAQEKRAAAALVEKLEERLGKLSSRQEELVELLSTGQAADYAALNRELAEIQVDIAAVTEKWEAAALKLEELEIENARIHES